MFYQNMLLWICYNAIVKSSGSLYFTSSLHLISKFVDSLHKNKFTFYFDFIIVYPVVFTNFTHFTSLIVFQMPTLKIWTSERDLKKTVSFAQQDLNLSNLKIEGICKFDLSLSYVNYR